MSKQSRHEGHAEAYGGARGAWVAVASLLWLGLCAAAPAWAEEPPFAARQETPGDWYYRWQAGQHFLYDSNPLRLPHGGEAVVGGAMQPALEVGYRTPRTELRSQSDLSLNLFDRSDYNTVDAHEALTLRQTNARWQAEARLGAEYDAAREVELASYNIAVKDAHRTRLSVAPQLAYTVNPRETLRLYTSYADVAYDDAHYVDYHYMQAMPRYDYALDPATTLQFGARAGRYETARAGMLRADTLGPSLGLESKLTTALTATVSAGTEYFDKTGANAGSDPNGWNYVFRGALAYSTAADTLTLSLSRAQEPYGNGSETLLSSVGVELRHGITPRWQALGEGKWMNAEYHDEPGVNLDHGYLLGAGTRYALTQAWAVDLHYRLRNDTLTQGAGEARAQQVLLGLNYAP